MTTRGIRRLKDGERARQPAHELRQPLTVVLSNTRGCLEMIGDGCDPTELTERLEPAAATAERAAEIRREKRDRGRKETGTIFQPVPAATR